MLRQNLARCLAAGLDQERGPSLLQPGSQSQPCRSCPDLRLPTAVQGIAIATAADLPLSLYGLLAEQGRSRRSDKGRWGAGPRTGSVHLAATSARSHLDRFSALVTVGQVRIRRGDPDPLGPARGSARSRPRHSDSGSSTN